MPIWPFGQSERRDLNHCRYGPGYSCYFEALRRQNLVKVNLESVPIQEEHLNQAWRFISGGIRPVQIPLRNRIFQQPLNLIRADFAYQSSTD